MLSLLLPERCSVIKYDQVSLLSPFPPGYFFFSKAFHNKGGKKEEEKALPALLSCAEHLSGCSGGIGPCWILPFPSHHPSSQECEIISFLAQIGATEGTPPPPHPTLRQGWEEPGWFLWYFEWESGGYQTGFFTLGGLLGTAGVSLHPIFFYPAASVPCRKLLAAEPCHGKMG